MSWRRSAGRGRGRILAVKWGLNPNSSSLGVDVTFFLFGATALALATPVLSALIRWKRPQAAAISPDDSTLAREGGDDAAVAERERAAPEAP